MTSSLVKYKLSELATFKYGKTIRKSEIQEVGNFPVYSGYQIVGYLPNYKYEEPQLIIVCRGVGGTGDIKISPPNCSITNLAIVISCDENIVDMGYLYWKLLLSDTYSLRTGSAQPQITINTLENFTIEIEPDIDKQREIADILFCFNDKIELNRQINQTLEQIAQAIFKSWFVDFDPVKAKIQANQNGQDLERAAMRAISGKTDEELDQLSPEHRQQLAETAALFPDEFEDSELGETPKGWEPKTLSKLIELIGGGTPKRSEEKYWGGDIPWFSVKDAPPDGDVFVIDTEHKITELGLNKSSTKLLDEGVTIISARGTVGRLAMVGVPMAMNQSCYGVKPAEGLGIAYNYFNLKNAVKRLKQQTHGAVFDTITSRTFESIFSIKPHKDCVVEFENLVTPMLLRIKSNLLENSALAECRDVLLPKLLSGEIDLSDIESTEEAVA